MKKAAIIVGFVVPLLCAGALWCGTRTSPRPSQPSELVKVLSKAASVVREKTAVPLRLPTQIAGLDEARTGDIYAIVETADETGYSIILGADPDCKGQHACSYGTLIGTTRPLSQVDVYDVVHRRGTPVILANGLKGHFYDTVCGAYCSDSLIVWSEGKFHYIIGLKAERKSNLIKTANSAIRAS